MRMEPLGCLLELQFRRIRSLVGMHEENDSFTTVHNLSLVVVTCNRLHEGVVHIILIMMRIVVSMNSMSEVVVQEVVKPFIGSFAFEMMDVFLAFPHVHEIKARLVLCIVGICRIVEIRQRCDVVDVAVEGVVVMLLMNVMMRCLMMHGSVAEVVHSDQLVVVDVGLVQEVDLFLAKMTDWTGQDQSWDSAVVNYVKCHVIFENSVRIALADDEVSHLVQAVSLVDDVFQAQWSSVDH